MLTPIRSDGGIGFAAPDLKPEKTGSHNAARTARAAKVLNAPSLTRAERQRAHQPDSDEERVAVADCIHPVRIGRSSRSDDRIARTRRRAVR